ncbi:hypothetical protein AAF712_006966 [Marasmius tenuissimus]|uniref:Uncharacterized protein n=1 Tax=Marasmius tenuissimus TaxID=585030 RepID=A0ABR2ZY22_9AGAR
MAPQVRLCRPDTPRPLGMSSNSHHDHPRGPLDWYVLTDLPSVFIPNGLTLIAFDPITNTAVELTLEEILEIIHYGCGLHLNFKNLGRQPPKYALVAGLVNLYLAPWFRRRFTIVPASGNRYEGPAPVTYSNFFPINSEYGQRYRDPELFPNVHARYPKISAVSLPPPVYSSAVDNRGTKSVVHQSSTKSKHANRASAARGLALFNLETLGTGGRGLNRKYKKLLSSRRAKKEARWGRKRREFRSAVAKGKVKDMVVEMAEEKATPMEVETLSPGVALAVQDGAGSSANSGLVEDSSVSQDVVVDDVEADDIYN